MPVMQLNILDRRRFNCCLIPEVAADGRTFMECVTHLLDTYSDNGTVMHLGHSRGGFSMSFTVTQRRDSVKTKSGFIAYDPEKKEFRITTD